MEMKKRVVILATIAVILAVTAIALNVIETEAPVIASGQDGTGAVIGIDIQPAPVEDQLASEMGGMEE